MNIWSYNNKQQAQQKHSELARLGWTVSTIFYQNKQWHFSTNHPG